jgi:hypothetical protein
VEPWTSAPWVVFMSLAMGVGAYFAADVVRRAHAGTKVAPDMSRWMTEVQHACFDLVRAELHVADCRHRMDKLVSKVPADFNPTIWSCVELGKMVQGAALTEAAARGLITEAAAERYLELARTAREPEGLPGEALPEPEAAEDGAEGPTSHAWLAGQLIPVATDNKPTNGATN